MALNGVSIGFAEVIGLNLVPERERARGRQPLAERRKRALDGRARQADIETELLDDLAVDRIEFTFASADRKCGNPVVNGICERVDEIVGRREPQSFGPFEQREVLEVGVGVTQDQIEDDKTEKPIEVDPSSRGIADDNIGRLLVAPIIFAFEGPPSRPTEDLREIFEAQPLLAVAIEAFNQQRDPIDIAQPCKPRTRDSVFAEKLAGQTERKMLVLHDRGKILAIEFRDVCGRVSSFHGRWETIIGVKGEQLLLHPRQGPSGGGRRFVDEVVLNRTDKRFPVCREKAHCPDTVFPIMQEKSEIVLICRSARARLAPAQPAFRCEMFEKGYQAATPVMVPCLCGKRAGNRLAPAFVIDKAGVRAQLAEPTDRTTLEGDDGVAVSDGDIRST